MSNLEYVKEMFAAEDDAKDLLLNATTNNQEEVARGYLDHMQQKIKMLYIPTPIENV